MLRKGRPELKLKDQSVEQLRDTLFDLLHDWDEDDRAQLDFAIDLMIRAHEGVTHKDKQYATHPLRVACRLVGYLGRRDFDEVVAAVLHDVPEDAANKILDGSLFTDDGKSHGFMDDLLDLPENEKRELAIVILEALFPGRNVAPLVKKLTNDPTPQEPVSYREKLLKYANHVKQEIEDIKVFFTKLSDWGDNGLGVIHDIEGQGEKHAHFVLMYSLLLPIFEERYYKPDVQNALDKDAKIYIENMFELARKRLVVKS